MSERATGNGPFQVLFGIALGLALIISTSIVMRTVARIKITNQTISVKGYAEKDIVSDWARWRGSFQVKTADLVAGYKELEQDLAKVLAYLTEHGVAQQDVTVGSVSTETQYARNEKGIKTNEIEAYILRQSVEIKTTDTALVDTISRGSTSLLKEGVEFTSHHPEYLYTQLDNLKIEMIGRATENARRRAEQLVTKSGGQVGSLRAAQQGVFQITPKYSTEVSGYGTYDTSTIEKKIKAVVTIEYTIR